MNAKRSKPNGRRTRLLLTAKDVHPGNGAFTLIEVVISVAITALVFGGIITCYTQSARRAEWSGYSLAAHALAIQQLEQARSAKWDVLSTPMVNELTNVPPVTVAVLDLPISGTNVAWATNYATISKVAISTTPLVEVQMVKVDTVWRFRGRLYTNSLADYFAPE